MISVPRDPAPIKPMRMRSLAPWTLCEATRAPEATALAPATCSRNVRRPTFGDILSPVIESPPDVSEKSHTLQMCPYQADHRAILTKTGQSARDSLAGDVKCPNCRFARP